jgi:hypothetical protein
MQGSVPWLSSNVSGRLAASLCKRASRRGVKTVLRLLSLQVNCGGAGPVFSVYEQLGYKDSAAWDDKIIGQRRAIPRTTVSCAITDYPITDNPFIARVYITGNFACGFDVALYECGEEPVWVGLSVYTRREIWLLFCRRWKGPAGGNASHRMY